MSLRGLVLLVTTCVAVHAIGIAPKVDLPGVAKPRRTLGTDVLDPEKVQAVLQVKVKSSPPESSNTRVNAVVCLDADTSKCGKKENQGIRPSTDVGSEEEEESNEEIWRKMDEESSEEEGKEEEVEDEEEKEEVKKTKRKPLIVIVEEEIISEEKKKSKKKKVQDIPVIVGYKGISADEEKQFHNDVQIIPSESAYSPEETLQDVPVYVGLNLRPEFDNTQQTYSYINPPEKSDVPVTIKEMPFGFDESALVAHIFQTSPLISALQAKYTPSIQHLGVQGDPPLIPRVAVSDIPDYVAGVEGPYHHQQYVPGFYGGHQPRVYPQRGIVRTGTQGCHYPSRGAWHPPAYPPIHPPMRPTLHGKVGFTGDEEDPIHKPDSRVDTDDAGTSDSPVVIKIDGKLGGALKGSES